MDVKVNLIDDPRIPLRGVDTTCQEYAEVYDSIRLNGVLVPIVLRRKGDRFEVIDGLHRLTITRKLARDTIPARIEENCSDARAMFLSIQLNAQRVKTKPSEYCQQIKRLLDSGYTMTDLCGALSKSITWIKAVLSLDKLVPEAQALVDSDQISLTVACDIARIKRVDQWAWLPKAKKLKPRQFRALVDEYVKQLMFANSQGRLIEKYERMRPHAVVRTIKAMRHELETKTVATKYILDRRIKSVEDFAAGIEWCMSLDHETQEAMRRDFAAAANPSFKKERRRKN